MIGTTKGSRVTTLVTLVVLLSVAFLQGATPQAANGTAAPEPSIDQDIALLRKNLHDQRKQIIAANLPLTTSEAEKFWPVYDQYIGELIKTNNTKYALLKQYVQASGSLSDDQADATVKQWLDVDESVTQLRTKYLPMFSQGAHREEHRAFLAIGPPGSVDDRPPGGFPASTHRALGWSAREVRRPIDEIDRTCDAP